ncbi:MAG: hypothetical protein E7395_00700 [Ruminococcaceae bacterium]|nr:hypothetical protein [Oscillospiraceae bacterium]
MEKVILISIDGMRPDGLKKCGNAYLNTLIKKSTHTFCARTVFPSITLPCHLSLFHSVPPERHCTFDNTYIPPVHPINSLFDQLNAAGKRCAMYYGWEPIINVRKPGTLYASEYIHSYSFDHTDDMLTERALEYIKIAKPDFVFLYMVETDEKGGHDNGWMSDAYLEYISRAIDNVKRVIEEAGDEYTVIVTADHGGHDRSHGTDADEDMTIPMFFVGKNFKENNEIEGVSILDITPTIADVMKIAPAREWEGKSLVKQLH